MKRNHTLKFLHIYYRAQLQKTQDYHYRLYL